MSHPFAHPSARPLLDRVAHLFLSKKAFLRKNRHIVFVCGGPVQQKSQDCSSDLATPSSQPSNASGKNPKISSLRSQFLAYAETQLLNFRLFLAEKASVDLLAHSEPQFLDLAAFELLISDIADCIVLFPESAGSIAELGFFSNSHHVRKKILLVNDQQHQGSESFINLGPVHLINTFSKFKPSVILDFQSSTIDFSPVREKLIRLIRSSNRKAFIYESAKQIDAFEKLSIVLELVNIFQVVTIEHICHILTATFQSEPDQDELRTIISMLIALKFVERKGADGQHLVMVKNVESFFVFDNFEINDMRIEIVAYYQEHEPETFSSIPRLIE